jgi:hypothetical protein
MIFSAFLCVLDSHMHRLLFPFRGMAGLDSDLDLDAIYWDWDFVYYL